MEISTEMLIQIIHLLPNLTSLRVSALSPWKSSCLSEKDEQILHQISINNKIRTVNIEGMIELKCVQFFIDLCPYMQYLQLVSQEDMDSHPGRGSPSCARPISQAPPNGAEARSRTLVLDLRQKGCAFMYFSDKSGCNHQTVQ